MGELTPVREIDGRSIGWGEYEGTGAGPITKKLQAEYRKLPDREGYGVPLPDFPARSSAL